MEFWKKGKVLTLNIKGTHLNFIYFYAICAMATKSFDDVNLVVYVTNWFWFS